MDIERLKAILREEEGLRLIRYKDHLLNETIGYGHQRSDLPETCTEEQAEQWLDGDVKVAMLIARTFMSYIGFELLSETRKIVLVAMAFQLGNRLFDFRKFHHALFAKNYDKAADEMLDSLWAKQTPERAERMAQMMREG